MAFVYRLNGKPLEQRVEMFGWQPFAKHAQTRAYGPGETLFLQGDENRGVFCIRSGFVGLRRSDEQGNSGLVRLCKPGDMVGYPAFLGRKAHPNTAEVLTRSIICFLEASHLRWMLKHDPDLMESFVQQALSDLNRTEANCAALLTSGLRCRLFHLLLMLYESHGRSLNEGGYSIELPVQRKDLAALLGATPESISRLINRLAREGFVHFTARHVLVSDLDRLAAEVPSFS